MIETIKCKYCGKAIPQIGYVPKTICSHSCAQRGGRPPKPRPKKPRKPNGKTVIPGNPRCKKRGLYCSDKKAYGIDYCEYHADQIQQRHTGEYERLMKKRGKNYYSHQKKQRKSEIV